MNKVRGFGKRAAAAALAAALAGGCGTLDDILLRPDAVVRRTPAEFGYEYESKRLDGANGQRVAIWHVAGRGERRGIVVVVPGLDANKSRYVEAVPIVCEDGWDAILMDYEGFGDSTGRPTLEGLIRSTRTVFEHALAEHAVVVGYGASMGGPVLIRVAADLDLSACIFESGADLWREATLVAEQRMLLAPPFSYGLQVLSAALIPADYDSQYWIARVAEPKLFVHSPDDLVTPFAGAWDLYRLAPPPKHFFVTQGGHAAQPFMDPDLYRSVVLGWLHGALGIDPIDNPAFRAAMAEALERLMDLGIIPRN